MIFVFCGALIGTSCFAPELIPTYTVGYDGNGNDGGSVPVDSNFYEQGDTVTVLANTGSLTYTHYYFTGWNTAANGSGASYAASARFAMGAADVTLYAQWSPEIYISCQDILTKTPSATTGPYTIDPDGPGDAPSFETNCDMDTDGGGWTLVGIVSRWDEDSWSDLGTWTDTSTFGDLETANDYKNLGWSSLPYTQLMLKADGYSGVKVTDPDTFGGPSLAALFNTSERVSLTGTETEWRYNNGTLDIDDDREFFGVIQNPPTTALENYGARNACILTTAYDGWFGDDTVQGFGCIAGSGIGGPACDGGFCGDTSREDETWFYVR